MALLMSYHHGNLKNSNCFKRTHKNDFPKFGHILGIHMLKYVMQVSCPTPPLPFHSNTSTMYGKDVRLADHVT